MPKLVGFQRAWRKIVQHIKPVIQGVLNVVWGNSHVAERPPGGGFCGSYPRHRPFVKVETNH